MPPGPLPQDSGGGWGPQRRLRTFPEGCLYAGDVHVREFFPLTPRPLSGRHPWPGRGQGNAGPMQGPQGASPPPLLSQGDAVAR